MGTQKTSSQFFFQPSGVSHVFRGLASSLGQSRKYLTATSVMASASLSARRAFTRWMILPMHPQPKADPPCSWAAEIWNIERRGRLDRPNIVGGTNGRLLILVSADQRPDGPLSTQFMPRKTPEANRFSCVQLAMVENVDGISIRQEYDLSC